MQLLLPRGFSANLVLIIWFLFGGVCLLGFEANLLKMMLKHEYEEPIDSAQDIVDRGMIPIIPSQHYMDNLKQSPNVLYQQLAEKAIMFNILDYAEWQELQKTLENDLFGAGTHVYLAMGLSPYQQFGSYHLSKEKLAGVSPWFVWIVNKKWPLNDALAKHILLYQQVCWIFFL
jgi:hypothetical protein